MDGGYPRSTRRYSAPELEVRAGNLGDAACTCPSLGSVLQLSSGLSGAQHVQNRRSRAGAEPRVHLLSLGSVQGEVSLAVQWPISPVHLYCILACSCRYSDPMVVVSSLLLILLC